MKRTVRLLSLLMAMMMVIATVSVSFADWDDWTSEEKSWLQSNLNDSTISSKLTTNQAEGAVGAFEYEGTRYYWVDSSAEDTVHRYVQGKIASSNNANANSAAALDNVNEITNGLGAQADFGKASETLSGFVPVINIFLGIVCTLIVTFMTVFTAFDVCYIVFPVFRNQCEEAKATGQGVLAGKSANGGTKLRFVSDEAQYAVKSTQTNENGKSALSVYLGKRVFAYIMVAIILFILLTGNISLITRIALKMVAGIMSVLEQI